MSAIKILLADDESIVLDIMAQRVAAAGFQVVKAKDGQEAWDKICSEIPDVIVLDLDMPKMDGWQVLNQLRSHPPSKKWQPVIIVSADSDVDDIHKGLSLEADHYLVKPCRIEEILKAIKLMLTLIPQRQNPN